MFKPADPNKTLAQVEHDQIKYWNENDIFRKSVNLRKGNEKFVFFDGPPFANGLPHYGHILALSLKDAITRYRNMKGYYVPRTNGWDCHGLPVEYEIEKQLEISGHKEIEKFGIAKFNKSCSDSVFKYTKEWEQLFERLGRWFNNEETYATLENDYMESIWWVFKQIWDKKLVYQGYRSMHICPRCETPLSNFEVSQGYKDVTDFSATVKFPLKDDKNTYVLAWTTTPWTLPGNQLLAIGKDIEYVKVNYNKEHLILAKERLEATFGEESYEIIEELKANDLIGKKYKPIFNYFSKKSPFTIQVGDFVTTADGTGVVHIAGGFGEDDYQLVKSHDVAPLLHVGLDGNFIAEITDFAGKFCKGQDQNIAKILEEKGLLFKGENYRHSYPHCWRCDTPLLNYALKAWFVEVTKLKSKLIKNNQKINWQPPHIKEGRFGKWLENVKDWNISRNRFWGCAIPIWECKCGHQECISSVSQLRKKSLNGNNVYFVRHGFAEHNEEGVLSCNPKKIRHITEKGKSQAEKLGESLKEKQIDIIYCSPFLRAKETAEVISAQLGGVKIVEHKLITEHDCGKLDGLPFEVQTEEILASDDSYHHKPGITGESLKETERRMLQFMDYLNEKHSGKNILVVSHGGPLSLLFRYLDEKPVTKGLVKDLAYLSHDKFYHYYLGNVPCNEGKLDLHRPYIDEIKIKCEKCENEMQRIEEVFDCWFESGAMPYAQMHYPFESKEEFETNFPANFIAEGLDQTRGWFYTLHVLSTILFDEPAFKNVIVNGILLAKNGEKLSKRKKNYPDPKELFETKGVDSTRLFLYQSTAPLAEDVRFSEDHVDEILKKFTLTLWNTYSFFLTYASIDKFNPNDVLNMEPTESHELDLWIVSELHKLITEVTQNMEEYNLQKATRPLIDFVDNLSNWYVRRSRRRFWKSENDNDKYFAYHTLYTVLVEFSKLIAPFTPFIADEIFRNLTGGESVHLANWPEADKKLIHEDLNKQMETARTIVSLGHSLRGQNNLKVRQPLSQIKVAVPTKQAQNYVKDLEDVIKEELNIKKIIIIEDAEKEVTKLLKPDAKALGPKLGEHMKEVLQAAREGNFEIDGTQVEIAKHKLPLSDFEIIYQAKTGFSAASEGGTVVILDTTVTPELEQEGLVRDIIRSVQEFRKEVGYNVSDRIYLFLQTDNKQLKKAITEHADYIMRETLALEIQQKGDFNWDSEKLIEIGEVQLTIALHKAEI